MDENVGAHFNVVRTIIFSKKYVRILYMSFHSYRVVSSPYRDVRQMNLSYMVLLDMWNIFGQKFLSFIRG